jgi:hypothetical protein
VQPTLSDVASFAPASAPFVDEPDGVGIVGMPMNFVATAGVHEQAGTLFDLPVTVRFTPTSYRFIYGDGTSRDSPTGGRTWAALGRAQFSATDTSHAYAARGTYTATATVRYAAQANFGNGWIDVPGLLDIPPARRRCRSSTSRPRWSTRPVSRIHAGPAADPAPSHRRDRMSAWPIA